ncbi:leucine-rich repeat-containing G-protein coupled receptor 5-like [Siniperca chuatsi]|uniref:leucine-rich repeat-containing G-protein coupled receptor 5-like n=1 Tax=Siniperca chuatsi TaxID=119488 RepID=UPI001CE1B21F|nr:leucine-rich repeat-containing G-protein coupled receptor 5-like [Siniperca chuatsi]
MHLLVLVLTWVGVVEGGRVNSNCPAVCRCEGVGMLQRVDCVDVGLRSVPSNLSSFTSSLDVSMNQLSELPAHVFSSLHHLHELRLAGNTLTKISRDVFTGLVGLKLLTLQNNHLKTVPSEALENLKNLHSLRLDANFISRLPASSFKGLASLRYLWLDDNILTEVPVLTLSALTELQALTLALNNISYIPDRAFASLSQLLVLHLRDNCIHSLGRRSFDGLHNLQMLDLSFNRINSFPAAIKCLSNLRDLNLQNNNIRVIPENAFSGNPSIETINIQNNPLHTVGHLSFQLLPELQTLSLSGGSITKFPDFTGTNRLETLSITGSHISTVPDTICEELPNLRKLDLSHNLIQNLPSFSSCTKIQNIDLSSNWLSSVSLMSLQSLTHLKLSGHQQLRVSHQHRMSELPVSFHLCVFVRCETSSSSNSVDSSSPSACCLDSSLWLLHFSVSFIFIVSIVFNLLVLLSLLLSSDPPPPSSQHALALLFWFRLVAGLSGSSIINTNCFCGSSLDTDPGSGLRIFLFCLSSEICIFIMMAVVFKNRTWTKSCAQISCAVIYSFTLMVLLLIVM